MLKRAGLGTCKRRTRQTRAVGLAIEWGAATGCGVVIVGRTVTAGHISANHGRGTLDGMDVVCMGGITHRHAIKRIGRTREETDSSTGAIGHDGAKPIGGSVKVCGPEAISK